MRSPILLLIRMKAAETRASRAMADCTPLAVVWRSLITAEIDTFISDVSTTRTNMAMASRIDSFRLPEAASTGLAAESVLIVLLWVAAHSSGRLDDSPMRDPRLNGG